MPSMGVFAQGAGAKLYLPVRCVEASSLTNGYLVALNLQHSLSFDGNQAIMTASGSARTLPGWVGIAAGDIASNAFGLVQSWGVAASIYGSQQATSITINIGDACIPVAESGGAISTVPTYLNAGFKFILSSGTPNTTSLAKSVNYMAGLLKCISLEKRGYGQRLRWKKNCISA